MAPTDDVFQTLIEDHVPYDSSIISGDFENPWPYTLDYGLGDACAVRASSCPSGRYPGLWEIPVKALVMPRNSHTDRTMRPSPCTFPDTCPGTVNSASYVKELLDTNFRRHYHSNRAPLGINLHDKWFTNGLKRDSLNGLVNFLDDVLKHDDVIVLSIEQMLDFIADKEKDINNIEC